MEFPRILGIVLKGIRNGRTLTQARLAEICDLDEDYISKIERGLRQPSISTLLRIANALDISMTFLIEQTELLLHSHNSFKEKLSPYILKRVENEVMSFNKGMILVGLKKRSAFFDPESSDSVIQAIVKHYNKEQIEYISRKLISATDQNLNMDPL